MKEGDMVTGFAAHVLDQIGIIVSVEVDHDGLSHGVAYHVMWETGEVEKCWGHQLLEVK